MSERKYAVGTAHGRAVLTEAKVRRARESHRRGKTVAELAKRYGVSWMAMKNAIRGATWSHVPNPCRGR